VKLYKTFFDQGLGASDLMLRYGNSLEALKRNDEALEWYFTLAVNDPENAESYSVIVG